MNERLLSAVPLLLEWYSLSKRTLPWRGTHDPYRVLVSEIMLQQTRVEAVKDYYARFMERFPTATELANANEEEVLKYWEGLGYYSRARNLHKAAKQISASGFPDTYEEVRKLPGVGDYTAGAICSIAYELPCPAVDGNVLRVLTRLLADDSNIDDVATKKAFALLLKDVYPRRAGDFCQALMELGAIVCLPNGSPLCDRCPWKDICLAHLDGREEQYPVRAEKKKRQIVELTVIVLCCNGKYAIQKRSEKGLLAGMWQFLVYDAVTDPTTFGTVVKSKRVTHVFTHIEWHMTAYYVQAQSETSVSDVTWASKEEILSVYAMPSAFRALRGWIT